MDFELSGTNLSAFHKALGTTGKLDAVVALLSPEAREAFAAPHAVRWHPGRVGVEVWRAAVTVGGPGLLEDLNHRLTRDSFGPIVGPLVRIALTLSGGSPASVFARMGDAIALALRGVRFEWAARPPNAGTITLTYPQAMPLDVVEHGWRGIIRAAGEMAGKRVAVSRFVAEEDRRFRFELGW